MTSLLVRASLGLLLSLAASQGEAGAAARAQLSYSSTGASCAGISAMRSAVHKRLGYDPFTEDAELRVQVTLRERAGRLVGKARFLRSGEEVGEREMVGGRGECPGLVDSLALAISLALDPEAVDRPRLPRRPAEPTSERVGLSRLSSTSLGSLNDADGLPSLAKTGLIRTAELGGWARLGAGPADALGLSLGGSLRRADLSVALVARGRLPSQAEASQVLLTTYGFSVAVRVCLEGEGTRACALGDLGREHAVGEGLDDQDGVWSTAARAGLQTGVDVLQLGDWAFEAVAELLVPIIQQAYRSDSRELWRSPVVVLGVGLRARWSAL